MGASPPYISEDVINSLRNRVSSYFPVYSTGIDRDSIFFRCEVDESRLEEKFNSLRLELREMGYVPIIKEVKGEYLVYLTPFRAKEGKGSTMNIVMLVLTIFTTTFAGVIHWAGYVGSDTLLTPSNIFNGIIYFSLPLLLILGTHEMGHYFMAKKRNVRASLPFFIPFMPPLGTMGAFISLREPIPDRKSLLDIGIAGPIAGFMVAVPVTIVGMLLGGINPPASGGMEPGGTYMIIQTPLIYNFLAMFIPTGDFIHPTAFAGWVGFIVTAINLFPAGQLDGGHIARATLGDRAKYASYASLAALFAIGVFMNYWGWLIFAGLILFLGARHAPPLNDISPLDSSRKILGIIAALMLVVSFVPVPMDTYSPVTGLSLEPMDSLNISAEAGSEFYFNFTVINTGELDENITLMCSAPDWNISVFDYGGTESRPFPFNIGVRSGESANFTMVVRIPGNATPYLYEIRISGAVAGFIDMLDLRVLIPGDRPASLFVSPQSVQAAAGDTVHLSADISSLSESPVNISFSVAGPDEWEISIGGTNDSTVHLSIMPFSNVSVPFTVHVPESTDNGTYTVLAVLSSADGVVASSTIQFTVVQERSST